MNKNIRPHISMSNANFKILMGDHYDVLVKYTSWFKRMMKNFDKVPRKDFIGAYMDSIKAINQRQLAITMTLFLLPVKKNKPSKNKKGVKK